MYTLLVTHRYLVTGDAMTTIVYKLQDWCFNSWAINFRCVYCNMGCFGINTSSSTF